MAIKERNARPRILVAGCGALGGEIARRLSASAEVFGLKRSTNTIPQGVQPIAADLLQPQHLKERVPANLDAIVYCLTPSQYDDEGYANAYVHGLQNLLGSLSGSTPKRLVFISSTSVYHQDDDSWVTEDSPAHPLRATGQRILEGEQIARDSGIPALIVRFSGIYGPSRQRFLTEVQEGRMNPSTPAPYSNRIHEADAADAVAYLLAQALAGQTIDETYIVSDCEPVRLDEVVSWVRTQTPCANPVEGARTGGRAGSKRCSNQRLLASGFQFRYPDFRAGYGDMITRNRASD
ncbi:NAD-dependent epimerase/dehydratase family protein [Marinobacter zhejiangensis]|uniref:Nucleoside-diphosphate-sugar epimerase n=1 Tax=Marinobacter zhejiangensis TaxID=488535 RepID=A0A1I4MG27_9GAMM|nr:NAD-dependent epimerase/dehydratase family protein [Marinobacter zhejiangensis]SFM02382.1 Nucleoside-diphosphate-sugar epimerase [Marinobacter zhejiangensis]